MINYDSFNVVFFSRKIKSAQKLVAIYARIGVNGERVEISLKRKVVAKQWDSRKGRAKGTTREIRLLNKYFDQEYARLLDCHRRLLKSKNLVTANAIKKEYIGVGSKEKTLLKLIEYHNSKMESTLKYGTRKNYYTTARYLKKFVKAVLKKEDIYLKQVNYQFIKDFEFFLLTYKPKKPRKTCAQNGSMKHLERLQKLLNLAIKLEWIEKSPFANFQITYKKKDRDFLSKNELEMLEEKIFESESLQKSRDIFLFACYSGLSYIDIKQLTKENIRRGVNGRRWIYTTREKTETLVKIPLLSQACRIMEKYEGLPNLENNGRLLPVISNQKLNQNIKLIFSQLGFNKIITFHSARHTFATTVTLANGVPLETVSKLLGHKKLSTTQIYARVLEEKIGQEMEVLDDKLGNSINKKGAYCRRGKSYPARI